MCPFVCLFPFIQLLTPNKAGVTKYALDHCWVHSSWWATCAAILTENKLRHWTLMSSRHPNIVHLTWPSGFILCERSRWKYWPVWIVGGIRASAVIGVVDVAVAVFYPYTSTRCTWMLLPTEKTESKDQKHAFFSRLCGLLKGWACCFPAFTRTRINRTKHFALLL